MDKLLEKYVSEEYSTKKALLYKVPLQIRKTNFFEEIQKMRRETAIQTPLKDVTGTNLWFNITEKIVENINVVEQNAMIKLDAYIPEGMHGKVLEDVLLEEALSSSAIEGAFSTKKRVRELIKKKLSPIEKSEKMLVNNFKALEYILDNIHKPLDREFLFRIWGMITEGALEEGSITNSYRDDDVHVENAFENVYTAPNCDEVPAMMADLINYFNMVDDTPPIVKASIIHFYFVYVHPFFDGNGRTARALAALYLIKSNYEFFKFISISTILQDKRNAYYKVILDSETHEGDITYFIEFYTKLLVETVETMLNKYITEYFIEFLDAKEMELNERQIKVLKILLQAKDTSVNAKKYMKLTSVTQETARTDLNGLVDLHLLDKAAVKRSHEFKLKNVEEIIAALTNKR